jgi:hypothetical protein
MVPRHHAVEKTIIAQRQSFYYCGENMQMTLSAPRNQTVTATFGPLDRILSYGI